MSYERGWSSKIAAYIMDLVLATAGVSLAALLLAGALETIFGESLADRLWLGPIFPAHIALGLVMGFLMNRKWQLRSTPWVWLPMAALLLLDVSNYARLGGLRFVAAHLFGRAGYPDEVFEQLLIVAPFYASVAYSIGAWLALKRSPSSAKSAW